jgi:hypothetical protein
MARQIVAQPTTFTEISVSGTDYSGGSGLLFVGTSGDVRAKGIGGGEIVTFKNIPNATILPLYLHTIYSGTTAADLIILEGPTENRG